MECTAIDPTKKEMQMSAETTTQNATTQNNGTQNTGVATTGQAERKQLDALHTEHGDTTIAETVVQKIAGLAAREVRGVHALGNAARRAFDNLAERIPGSQKNVSGGVSVEKGERQTAIDVSIIVEYGVSVVGRRRQHPSQHHHRRRAGHRPRGDRGERERLRRPPALRRRR